MIQYRKRQQITVLILNSCFVPFVPLWLRILLQGYKGHKEFRLRRIFEKVAHLLIQQTQSLYKDDSIDIQGIALLYKSRWQVELFFKWIKQHLRIKSFFGYTENALRCQI